MNAIYEPKGAAREYAERACNLYTGCLHGCLYCYAPGCCRKTREAFHSDVRARPGILQQLEKDADKIAAAGDKRRVLFCFTSDPYMHGLPREEDVTRQALQIMTDRGLAWEICTKGGDWVERDALLFQQGGGRLGISLVWTDELWAMIFEPRAAPAHERVAGLCRMSRWGIPTWASIEPVLDPRQALAVIRELDDAGCSEFRVGKINPRTIHQLPVEWQERVRAVDWQAFVDDAYDLLLQTGKRFLFKESLKPYLRGLPATGPEEQPCVV